jgi:hypothetical protein
VRRARRRRTAAAERLRSARDRSIRHTPQRQCADGLGEAKPATAQS